MKVRVDAFELTEDDRRAIRFVQSGRRSPCSREEARRWIEDAVRLRLSDLRYRWSGEQGG